MCDSMRPPRLHSVNTIRVLAEYLVVRFHILPDRRLNDVGSGGPIGMDIMCFFFVLSGFVMMYSFEHVDFSTWMAKRDFIVKRLQQVYPIFLFCWLCCLPILIMEWQTGARDCWVRKMCTFLQLFMLDAWVGCGCRNTVLGVSWFLSCLMWLWLIFPFIKDYLLRFYAYRGFVWLKIAAINLVFGFAFYLFWDYSIYTIAGLPLLRIGEFIIGCGAACALKAPEPVLLANMRFCIPCVLAFILYTVERSDHGMDWLCLHEQSESSDCVIWQKGQPWVSASPPCMTVMEKVGNKYALVWAVVIHGVSRIELSCKGGCLIRFLSADIFKFLSKFSLTLYLSHINVDCAIKWLGLQIFGWKGAEWSDDIFILLVYLLCYCVQCLVIDIVSFIAWVFIGSGDIDEVLEVKPLVALSKE